MTKVISGFLLGLFFVFIVAILAFVSLMAFTEKMRKKAVKKLMKLAKDADIDVSEAYLKRNIARLNIRDLKILDDWTTAMDKKDWSAAISMWPEARTALQKTDLGLIFGGLGTVLGTLTH